MHCRRSSVVDGTARYIRENRLSAARAFELRMLELRSMWSRTSHPMVLDRLNDLEDLMIRVLRRLLGMNDPSDLGALEDHLHLLLEEGVELEDLLDRLHHLWRARGRRRYFNFPNRASELVSDDGALQVPPAVTSAVLTQFDHLFNYSFRDVLRSRWARTRRYLCASSIPHLRTRAASCASTRRCCSCAKPTRLARAREAVSEVRLLRRAAQHDLRRGRHALH